MVECIELLRPVYFYVSYVRRWKCYVEVVVCLRHFDWSVEFGNSGNEEFKVERERADQRRVRGKSCGSEQLICPSIREGDLGISASVWGTL